MQKELVSCIRENNLSPFNRNKTSVNTTTESIYKTKDAKTIHNKLLSTIASNFIFADTSNLFNVFHFTNNINIVQNRQKFIESIPQNVENNFLKQLTPLKPTWKPKYTSVVVTEDEKIFSELQKLACPTKFIISQYDVESLENYEVVQVIECEQFSRALENLPQTIFLDSTDEVYLERYVTLLSSWKKNILLLKENNNTSKEIAAILDEITPLLELTNETQSQNLSREEVESKLAGINQELAEQIKQFTVSGESLFTMLSKSTLPNELQAIVRKTIGKSNLPVQIFKIKIPVEIDDEELESLLKQQNAKEFTSVAEQIKKKSSQLQKLPKKLQELSDQIVLFDFIAGISKFKSQTNSFPNITEELFIEESKNLFLDKAQPISFHLSGNHRCSILTGANSGGKTTLLEHMIQLNSLVQLGLPISGIFKTPLFTDVYYFAKSKGSLNKGAFETLLTQMSKIKPGKETLILADEIESVTEPGVAGDIVCASANYFLKKGCFLVIATHLGKEIQKNLPEFARIDGIEAKGLDENYELIVDHNPVLGRLANSTPELIIEKMANSEKTEYFSYLHNYLKETFKNK
jgi:DNA mismatch repair protein MutS2